MATPLIPQEIYLLERYSSTDYFGGMRDAWAKMVQVAEKALQEYVLKLPPDYRSHPLPQQPDIVWGERVLPNFRSTLEALNRGFITLSYGDLAALALGGNVQSAIKGQSSDFPTDWMPKELEVEFWKWQAEAGMRAFNMSCSEYAGWKMGSLSIRFSEQVRGPLNAPETWPIYRVNPAVRVNTGMAVLRSGVYLPSCDDSCAALLIEGYEAFSATVGYDLATAQNTSEAPTTWTLVERVANSGGGVPGAADSIKAGVRLRCEAGQPCPGEGYWFTPASPNSRRHFNAGEAMPDIKGPWGTTIWQWDELQ